MTIRALIFDFDGLIIDTEAADYQTWQEVYRRYGAHLPLEAWAIAVGRGFSADFEPLTYLEAQIGRSVDRAALTREREARAAELNAALMPLPGVVQALEDARNLGLATAVASSSPRAWVEGHLGRLGLLRHFDAIQTSDDVRHTKPEPDLFLAALAALNVRADEAIVLEDSPNGITAARRAGILVVAVPNPLTVLLPLGDADLIIRSLADWPVSRLVAWAGNGHRA